MGSGGPQQRRRDAGVSIPRRVAPCDEAIALNFGRDFMPQSPEGSTLSRFNAGTVLRTPATSRGLNPRRATAHCNPVRPNALIYMERSQSPEGPTTSRRFSIPRRVKSYCNENLDWVAQSQFLSQSPKGSPHCSSSSGSTGRSPSLNPPKGLTSLQPWPGRGR
jgi:hypothetical protein